MVITDSATRSSRAPALSLLRSSSVDIPAGVRVASGTPRHASFSHDAIERTTSTSSDRQRCVYDRMRRDEFSEHIEEIAGDAGHDDSAHRVLAEIHASHHPSRSAVVFAALCARFSTLSRAEREMLVVSAAAPGSFARRRPQLLRPIFDGSIQLSQSETRTLNGLISSMSVDAAVLDFIRVAGPSYHALPPSMRETIRSKAQGVQGKAERREALAMLAP